VSSPVLGGFREAEVYTGLSRRNLSRRLPEIEHFRIGTRVLFTRQGLDAFLSRYRITPRVVRKAANVDRVVAGLKRGKGR
jgi:hypothetical protein